MSADSIGCEQHLVVHFDFLRPPGIRTNCIGIVKDRDPFNWFLGEFYVATSTASFQTGIEVFKLAWKPIMVGKMIMDGLNHVEFLIHRDGVERATFEMDELNTIGVLLKNTKPLFDEYAIRRDLRIEPKLHGRFDENNIFGTWSDACSCKLSDYAGVDLVWKKVGTDGALLPRQSKRVHLRRRSTDVRGKQAR